MGGGPDRSRPANDTGFDEGEAARTAGGSGRDGEDGLSRWLAVAGGSISRVFAATPVFFSAKSAELVAGTFLPGVLAGAKSLGTGSLGAAAGGSGTVFASRIGRAAANGVRMDRRGEPTGIDSRTAARGAAGMIDSLDGAGDATLAGEAVEAELLEELLDEPRT